MAVSAPHKTSKLHEAHLVEFRHAHRLNAHRLENRLAGLVIAPVWPGNFCVFQLLFPVNFMLNTIFHHRQRFSPFFFVDNLHQIGNFLLICLWSVSLFWLWHTQYPDFSPGWLIVPVVFLWWLLFSATWNTYRVVVGERTWLLPGPFRYGLLGFLLLLLIAAMLHWLAFVSLYVIGLVIAMYVREQLVLHQHEWIGQGGTFLRPARWAKRFNLLHIKRGEKRLSWAAMDIPWIEGTRNFALFGAVSAGKTIMLRLFMQSFIQHIGVDPNIGVSFIYDAKRDMISIIRGINRHCKLLILNYRDARCARWDIAKDCTDQTSARTVGVMLSPPLPTRPGNGDFWIRASQHLLEGLCLAFSISAPGQWTLRDLLVGISSPERLTAILSASPETERYLYILQSDRLTHSVLVSIQVFLGQYAPIASAWHTMQQQAKKHNLTVPSFSIREIINEPAIVLLGRDVENLTAMTQLNSLILTMAGRFLLQQPGNDEQREPRHLIGIDEFHTMGLLPEWEELATNGSGKGVCLAIAMQSYASLQRIYGNEAAEAIMGQFFRRGFLRLNDYKTASWASDLIGEGERFKKKYDSKTKKWTTSDEVERVRVVTPDELCREQPPAKGMQGLINKLMGRGGTPLRGYFRGNFGFWRWVWPGEISRRLKSKADVQNIIKWDIPNLDTWHWADIERLGLTKVINPEDLAQHHQEEDDLLRDAKKQGPCDYQDLYRRIKGEMPESEEKPDGDNNPDSDAEDDASEDDDGAAGAVPARRPKRPNH